MRSAFAIVLAAFFIASCSQPGSKLPRFEPQVASEYRLDTDDQLRIIVFGQEELSDVFRVNDAGNISLPLVGSIRARGYTTEQLKQALTELLSRDILKDPSVSVEISDYRPFFILGEVKQPGKYEFIPGMHVLTAVAIGGGFTTRAQTDYVSISRQHEGRAIEFRGRRDSLVQPGDVIFVFEKLF